MKRSGTFIALAVVLAVAAFLLRGKGRQTPEDAARSLFEAAQRGDAAAYMALLTGRLRTAVESTQSQLGPDAFADSLRRSVAGIKGIGMSRAADAPAGNVALEVELTFADRNERQRFELAPQGGGWVIAAIDKAEVRNPSIPYGTPVFDDGSAEPPQDAKSPVAAAAETPRNR